MPIPARTDAQIKQRFEELAAEAKRLVRLKNNGLSLVGPAGSNYTTDYHKLRTNFLNLIQLLCTKRNTFSDLIKDARSANLYNPAELEGMILGLKSDYEEGLLRSITEMVEVDVIADYLEQAEGLLKDKKSASHSYLPAAVLAGAVLEDSLRRLCLRQTPSIKTSKPGGQPKTLGSLIDDLKDAGLYNELKAKQLRAWADIRNAAAHGRFDDFTRTDAENMIKGIQDFLADYL